MTLSLDRRRFVSTTAAAAATLAMPRIGRAQERTRIRIGVVPLISSGPIFLAQARGFFEKVGLDVELRYFADGVLAMPALVAGELDTTVATLNAGLFNTVSKGAPFKLILDRGSEKPGSGSMTIAASNDMVTAGMTAPGKMGLLKGKRVAIQAPGGIDQYLIGLGVQRAGLDPRTDVEWSSGLAYPDIVKAIGAGRADAANVPVPLGFLVEKNNFGKLVFSGYDIEPNTQLACWVMSQKFLDANKSAAVRFAMVHTWAGRLYNKAAAAKDPDVIRIISEATKVPPPLIEAAAPRWTWFNEDGKPNIDSCMAQGRFWTEQMKLVSGRVTQEQLFDLSPAVEANAQLEKKNPFV
ncbi:ABC transporter substrate-binding protein [Rhodoplanes sp. TEM]|uniref:ABC transporter substrate-binding protein n=1 Tax=Rhodoplanes tepidamans TaxID=200616 RepID=A0ABT5J8W2_RHOTP|nr:MULTISPECIES: ABC transporter substrate-binding protein [Rhodoplanes]MDC7786092.1 ABC transporter substrate-binding protein [Rhodoplanes tepidamans]MDC7985634.1 ABC transporter substrate-binding protein [Rhodoplanes sp. TEM]MDQ0357244.1 NitT/TauT family transport system substrate-binding protein [Rhodoplanes tepidamans]